MTMLNHAAYNSRMSHVRAQFRRIFASRIHCIVYCTVRATFAARRYYTAMVSSVRVCSSVPPSHLCSVLRLLHVTVLFNSNIIIYTFLFRHVVVTSDKRSEAVKLRR